jgi:serine/threonine-protein kinase
VKAVPTPDELVDGKYRLGRKLGEGGMGTVYVAEHTFLRRQVALKLLRKDVAEQPGVAARFQIEAQAASRLDHPSIVRVTDFGRTPDGQLYLVMELLEGHPLSDETRGGRPVERARALWIAGEICAALEAAHAAGVVHRDLKPENVLVCPQPGGREQLKIVDFGLAKLQGPEVVTRLTHTGTVMGTPEYMAPEQARGDADLDARVDVYALGVILYELLSGGVPFRGDNYNIVIFQILTGEPIPLGRAAPAIDEPIERLVMRAIAARREDRFPGARELGQALRALGAAAPPAYRIPAVLELNPLGAPDDRALSPTRPAMARPPAAPELMPLEPAPPARGAPEEAPASPSRLLEVSPRESRRPIPLARDSPLPPALEGPLDAVAAIPLARVSAPPPSPDLAPARPARRGRFSIALALAVALAAGGYLVLRARGERPTSVRIWIDGRPAGASLFVDGAEVAGNPFSIAYSEAIHQVRVEQRGRPARVYAFKPNEDQHVDVTPAGR